MKLLEAIEHFPLVSYTWCARVRVCVCACLRALFDLSAKIHDNFSICDNMMDVLTPFISLSVNVMIIW